MTMRAVALACFAALALGGGVARAELWGDASKNTTVDKEYAELLDHGDDLIRAADSPDPTTATSIRDDPRNIFRTIAAGVDQGIAAYEQAAKLEPDAAEPYLRIANALLSFYFECGGRVSGPLCSPGARDPEVFVLDRALRARAEQLIAAWDHFEQRAPHDPRVEDFLFERAILHTKLFTPAHLEAAARDYERIGRIGHQRGDEWLLALGNLAETYMMLDRLDEAIPAYERAIESGVPPETYYGLAVALDRAGRTEDAKLLIIDLGPKVFQTFLDNVVDFQSFFVPAEEKFYYLALCEEAFGDLPAAREFWKQFVTSGVYPQYQARAKQHLAALAKIPTPPPPRTPTPPTIELDWP